MRLPPPPFEISPPGGGRGGDCHFTVLLDNLYCGGLCSPSVTHTRSCMAFPLLQISHLCVFCNILSPKVVYRVSRPFFRPKMFSPCDHVWYQSRTLGAHLLATVVGPSPNGPQFCHMRYIRPGGVTQVDHESAQLSRLQAVAVASPKSLHLCSVCLHQWRVPQFALKYPYNPPPLPQGGGDRRALREDISRGGGLQGFKQCQLPVCRSYVVHVGSTSLYPNPSGAAVWIVGGHG